MIRVMAEEGAGLYRDELRRDIEQQAEASGDYELATRWRRAIEHARRSSERYRRQAERSEQAYENRLYSISGSAIPSEHAEDLEFDNELPVNVYFGNIDTQKPLIFSQLPIPVVRRRAGRASAAENVAAEILQRCLKTTLDLDLEGLEDTFGRSRDDYLIRARGLMEVGLRRGGTYTQPEPIGVRIGGDRKWRMPDGMAVPAELVTDKVAETGLVWPRPVFQQTSERIEFRYLDPMEVLIHPARRWEDVQWVAILEQPTRRQLALRFGKRAAARARYSEGSIDSLDQTSDGLELESPQRDTVRRATVWRIIDRVNRRTIYLAEGADRSLARTSEPEPETDQERQEDKPAERESAAIIAIESDELELPDFFPLPKPVQTVESNRRIDPQPEFIQYESLFWELQEALYRFFYVTRGVQVVAVTAGQYKSEVEQIFSGGPGPRTVTVTEQMAGGLRVADILEWVPLDAVTTAMTALMGTIRDLKALLFEVSGIPDIMRGQSQSRETATVGRQKVEFGAERISEKKRRFARFVRTSLRIAADLMASKFAWNTLIAMSGVQVRTRDQINRELAEVQASIQAAQNRARRQLDEARTRAPAGAQPPEPPTPELPELERRVKELEAEPDRTQVENVLRKDMRRTFAIDIETDSTIVPDQQAQRENLVSMMEAVGHGAQTLMPMLEGGFIPKKFAARFFARALEGFPGTASREIVDELLAYEPPPAAPPPPPPEQIRADAMLEQERMRIEHEAEEGSHDRRVRMEVAQGEFKLNIAKLLLAVTDQERTAAGDDADRVVRVLEIVEKLRQADRKMLSDERRAADDRRARSEQPASAA